MGNKTNLATPFVDHATEDNFLTLTMDGALKRVLTATATLNFGSIAANTSADLTITVDEAALNDVVMVGAPVIEAGIGITGFVSAANTVTVRAENNSVGAIDPASATYRVVVYGF